MHSILSYPQKTDTVTITPAQINPKVLQTGTHRYLTYLNKSKIMTTVTKQISKEFSKGNFPFTYNYMAEDVQWNVVGASVIKGKEAVIAHCNKMLGDMDGSVLTNTKHIVGEDSIATEGYCDYSNDGKPGRVEYCDVYKFDGEKLQGITSYCIEIKLG